MNQQVLVEDDSIEQFQAELDLVQAAYCPKEVRIDGEKKILCRRYQHNTFVFLLCLDYSDCQALHITGTVEQADSNAAYAAIDHLVEACRTVSEEGMFSILQQADEWMQEQHDVLDEMTAACDNKVDITIPDINVQHDDTIARNMIYSHHIIGKQKRADMKHLGSDLKLTGFIKIGWPGLMVIEGAEEDVQFFYDTIRRWQWKYLVLRGEMKDDHRLFPPLQEVSDIAVVADHCRQVGLESLFRTSTKLHPNANAEEPVHEEPTHGALIHVDHMNDGKSYRKWLTRTCYQQDVSLLIRQCFNGRPIIIVCLFGTRTSIGNVMQQWRSSNVDIDSKRKPCRERKMTVLLQGSIPGSIPVVPTEDLHTTREKLEALILDITKMPTWIDAMDDLW